MPWPILELVVLARRARRPPAAATTRLLACAGTTGPSVRPGRGTQRQILFAGVTASQITPPLAAPTFTRSLLACPACWRGCRLDRCRTRGGQLPGGPAGRCSAAAGTHRCSATSWDLRERRSGVGGGHARPVPAGGAGSIDSAPTVGYRLMRADGRHAPDRWPPWASHRPDVGRCSARAPEAGGRTVTVEHVIARGPGPRFAFVMTPSGVTRPSRVRAGRTCWSASPPSPTPEAALARRTTGTTAGSGRAARGAAMGRAARAHPFSHRYSTPDGDMRRALEASGAFAAGRAALDPDRVPVPPAPRS